MKKIVKESIGTGAGYSMSSFSGSRGGFGGAGNLGKSNTMYTYEIKPLQHTLEQKPTSANNQTPDIQIGSNITGNVVMSNANPDKRKKVTGIIQRIVKSENNALEYYLVMDEKTKKIVRVDPIGVHLNVNEPIKSYQWSYTGSVPSRRQEKRKGKKKAASNAFDSFANWKAESEKFNEDFEHLDEKYIDTVVYRYRGTAFRYDVYKNPYPDEIPADIRALADKNGNLWVVLNNEDYATHTDIYEMVSKNIDNDVDSPYKYANFPQGNSIALQRVENTNVFGLGESYGKDITIINKETWKKVKEKNTDWKFVEKLVYHIEDSDIVKAGGKKPYKETYM